MSHSVPAVSIAESSSRPGPKTLSVRTQLRLLGLKVCHLSPMQTARDERAFSRQCMPLIPFGVRPVIIGPHSSRGSINDVEFVQIPKSRNRALRILLSAKIVYWALKQKAHIYHAHSPELIPAALILRLLFRKKVVYDSREDFPAMMLTKTYLPKPLRSPMAKLVSGVEQVAARLLDGVITADPGSLRPLARTGSSKKLVFYNFPNVQYFPEPLASQKPYDLVYRGGLSERAGTFVLLKAVRLLLDRGIQPRLLLFGYTDNAQVHQSICDRLKDLGIEHLVKLGGFIPYEEMAATLSLARIAICPLQDIPKFRNNIPVKVFESWACGLPVIATDLPPIRPFFSDRTLGVLFRPGDSVELADAIQSLLESPQLIAKSGRHGRQLIMEKFNATEEAHKLLTFYETVLAC
jgi:glycosyltransferase involved in cell wall biosynthesis